MPLLTKAEDEDLAKIKNTYYMPPSLAKLDAYIQGSERNYPDAIKEAFNYIFHFMQDAESEVGALLEGRLKNKEITDVKQARKSIAGNLFIKMIRWLFLKNKEAGNIPAQIFITTKQTAVKQFGEDFIVYVDDEQQKPDCDLIIYNQKNQKIMILSLKTSLRERAGQIDTWKLLLEIATSKEQDLKKKYGIRYKGKNIPIICFATVNFYNEINNPQQRGMFKFFDGVFIAKPNVATGFIKNLSEIVDFINKHIV